MKATDIRKGFVLRFRGQLFRVLSLQHLTPGNKRGMVQVEMKEVEKGTKTNHRFRADDTVEKVSIESVTMEYLYQDEDMFVFMNSENYEQLNIPQDVVGDAASYLLPNTKADILFIEERPIGVELPQKMSFEVVETEPGIKNATATNVNKPATLETGLVVQVPPFINVGEKIIVNTGSGEYISRA